MLPSEENAFGLRGSVAADGCAGCNGGPSTATIRSRYREPRGREHDWRCNTCGSEWTKSTQV